MLVTLVIYTENTESKNPMFSRVSAVHACNPGYYGGWNLEDFGPRLDQGNSSRDSISKMIRAKWTWGVTHALEPGVQTPGPSPTQAPAKKIH
jgi:hypothetical protein